MISFLQLHFLEGAFSLRQKARSLTTFLHLPPHCIRKKAEMKSPLNDYLFDTFLEKVACLHPRNYLGRDIFGRSRKCISSSSTSTGARKSPPIKNTHRGRAPLPLLRRGAKKLDDDFDGFQSSCPVPTATLSDISPLSSGSGSDDDFLNYMIDMDTLEEYQPKRNRKPAVAPIVPPPSRVKAIFMGPPRPFGLPLAQKSRHHQSSWKGKTVTAARCVGPF